MKTARLVSFWFVVLSFLAFMWCAAGGIRSGMSYSLVAMILFSLFFMASAGACERQAYNSRRGWSV